MKIILFIIFLVIVRRFFVKSKALSPPSIEITICRVQVEKITIPRISCNKYFAIDAKANNGSSYSLLLPSNSEYSPIEVGDRVTIVLDDVWYIIHKGVRFYDYTRYLQIEHQRR